MLLGIYLYMLRCNLSRITVLEINFHCKIRCQRNGPLSKLYLRASLIVFSEIELMFCSDTVQTYNVLECCQHSCEASAICHLLVYSTLSILSYPWALHPSCSPSCCLNKLIYCCFFLFPCLQLLFREHTHTYTHPSFHFPQKSLAILLSPGWNLPPSWKSVKVIPLCPPVVTPWIIQSMEFSRLEYWSG